MGIAVVGMRPSTGKRLSLVVTTSTTGKATACQLAEPDLHLDACPRAAVQAPPAGVCQSSVLDGRKGDPVAGVCDGVHLLDEGQG